MSILRPNTITHELHNRRPYAYTKKRKDCPEGLGPHLFEPIPVLADAHKLNCDAALVARRALGMPQVDGNGRWFYRATLADRTGERPLRAPVHDCPPGGFARARTFTASELEAARWLADRPARVFKPARKSSRLARLMQRLN